MTIDESIEVLTRHELHWEHLLEQGICDAHEGKETISAFKVAIASLEAWEKVKAEIEDYKEKYIKLHHDWDATMIQGYDDALMVIDKNLQEVTADE